MTVTYKFSMVYKHRSLLKKLTDKSFVSHTLPCNILDTLSNVYTQTYIQELYIYLKKKNIWIVMLNIEEEYNVNLNENKLHIF